MKRCVLLIVVGALGGCPPELPDEPVPNAAPWGRFLAPARIQMGVEGRFDAAESFDPDGTILSYLFVWGDATPSDLGGPVATHAYAFTGVFPVVLVVSDDADAAHEVTHHVAVTIDPPARCGNLGVECPLTQRCLPDGLCYHAGPGDACAADADCAAVGTGCFGGACTEPECEVEEDCGPATACRGGLCQPLAVTTDGGADAGAFDGGEGDGG